MLAKTGAGRRGPASDNPKHTPSRVSTSHPRRPQGTTGGATRKGDPKHAEESQANTVFGPQVYTR